MNGVKKVSQTIQNLQYCHRENSDNAVLSKEAESVLFHKLEVHHRLLIIVSPYLFIYVERQLRGRKRRVQMASDPNVTRILGTDESSQLSTI